MPELTINFDVKPFPKERPRATRSGMMYTPQKTRDYEKLLAGMFTEHVGDTFEPLDCPLHVKVDIASHHVSVTINTLDHKPKGMRGDLDNYVKAVLDALNGVAWVDDRQIVSVEARKVGP
ncbi:MAG: RusA family crossover junction endodeoxyribonuclease [Ilumatobacteraceae bacterium]